MLPSGSLQRSCYLHGEMVWRLDDGTLVWQIALHECCGARDPESAIIFWIMMLDAVVARPYWEPQEPLLISRVP